MKIYNRTVLKVFFSVFCTLGILTIPAYGFTTDVSRGLSILKDMEAALVNLSDKTRPAVVTITPYIKSNDKKSRSIQRVRPTNTGTGVIIDGQKGLIVTNSHVVKDMSTPEITLMGGKQFRGKVIGADEETDLAVVQIESKSRLPEAHFGDSSDLHVGQIVIAVGNPFGLDSTMTFGIVSGLNRENINISRYEDFIQTDASINPGNSGGPLLNLDGEIIGVNTAIINYAQNIGFSIPVNMVKAVVEDLIESGEVRRGWLGVGIEPVDKEKKVVEDLGLGQGVYLNAIFEGEPAEKAGLKIGDIIFKVGGSYVKSPATMVRVVGGITPGQLINVHVLRNGKKKVVPVTMGIAKKKERVAMLPRNSIRSLGLAVRDLGQVLKEKYNLFDKEGVVVTDIFPDGRSEKASLKKGDLIVAINGQSIKSRVELKKVVGDLVSDDTIFLLISRGKESIHITVEGIN
jgi:serine protease Do